MRRRLVCKALRQRPLPPRRGPPPLLQQVPLGLGLQEWLRPLGLPRALPLVQPRHRRVQGLQAP